MCCHGVCVQGLHSTGHLQHPTQELAIRVATLAHVGWTQNAIAGIVHIPSVVPAPTGGQGQITLLDSGKWYSL